MTLQVVKGRLYLPRPINATGFGGFVIDAADEKAACMVQAPKTGTISKIGWRSGTVTTGADILVRVETLDESASRSRPSGTLWATDTSATQTVQDTDDNTWFTTTLTAGASVTKGDKLAVVISQPSSSAGNMQVSSIAVDTLIGTVGQFPYGMIYTTSWTGSGSAPLAIALEYSDGSYEFIETLPIKSVNSTAFSNSSTPDSRGLRFQLPFPCRVTGGWVYIALTENVDIKLVNTSYDQGAGTGILASVSFDKDTSRIASANFLAFAFTATVNLSASTNYRLLIEPSSTTNLTVYDHEVNSLALLDAYPGGQNFHLTTAKDPTGDGSWTNYNNGTDGYRVPPWG